MNLTFPFIVVKVKAFECQVTFDEAAPEPGMGSMMLHEDPSLAHSSFVEHCTSVCHHHVVDPLVGSFRHVLFFSSEDLVDTT